MSRDRNSKQEKNRLRYWGIRLFTAALSSLLFLAILEGVGRLLADEQEQETFFYKLIENHQTDKTGDVAKTRTRIPCYETDEILFWKMRPFLDECPWDASRGEFITTNSYGFRTPEFDVPKPAGVYRILCFGDSVTYGMRVPPDKNFCRLLEAGLNEYLAGELRCEVVNAGTCGYSSYQGLKLLETVGITLNGDAMVISFGFNDRSKFRYSDRSLGAFYHAQDHQNQKFLGNLMNWLYEKSSFFSLLRHFVYRRLISPGYNSRRVSPEEYQENLESFVSTGRAGALDAVFMVPPYRGGLDLSEYERRMRLTAEKMNVPCLFDIMLTSRKNNVNADYFADDAHPNVKGHRLIAELLFESVLKLPDFKDFSAEKSIPSLSEK